MIWAGLFAAILPFAAAAGLVRATGPGFRRGDRVLATGLAAIAGLGLASVTHLLRLLWLGPRPSLQWLVDAGLVLIAGIALIARAGPPPASARGDPETSNRDAGWWTAGLNAVLTLGAAAVVMRLTVWPHGPGSDSVAIWTLKARMLFRDEANWSAVLGPEVLHSRYPLLLPALTARLWLIGDGDGPWAPQLLAGSFLALTAGVLLAGLRMLRGPVPAAWAGMTLFLLPAFVTTGTAEIADVPLGCFALATVVTLTLAVERPEWRERSLVLAGLFASLGTLTKTEGQILPFAALGSLVCVRGLREGWARMARSSGLFVLGAAPLFAGGLWLTLRYATVPSEYVQPLDVVLPRAIDRSRHWLILTAGGRFGLAHPEIVLLPILPVLVPGVRTAAQRAAIATVGTMLGGIAACYYLVYLTTPYPLDWQLSTSFERLIVQYWPAAIWFVFLAYPLEPEGTTPASIKPARPAT